MKSLLLLIISISALWSLQSAAKPLSGVISASKSSRKKNDSFSILAKAIQSRVNEDASYDVDAIASSLRNLSKAQNALKKIDGTAHEMYQRTHKSSTNLAEDEDDEKSGIENIGSLKVAGRMTRKAARLGCVADSLFAAELCELNITPPTNAKSSDEDDGTLASWTGRKVLLRKNVSANSSKKEGMKYPSLSVMVIYEPGYAGGAGASHGGVDDLLRFSKDDLIQEKDENVTDIDAPARGRYLIIISDDSSGNIASADELSSKVSILDTPPRRVQLTGESCSVCEPLYQLAGQVVQAIEATISGDLKTDEAEGIGIQNDFVPRSPQPAIHFVGHSLGGGVGALAALIFDGSLPPPEKRSRRDSVEGQGEVHQNSRVNAAPGRTSAFCLGPPPCISSNVKAPFITSIIHGDDIICRTSQSTLKHLCERSRQSIKGGVLGRSIGWMTDTVSFTVSGLKSQSKKTKEDTLVLPGKVFLIRPRRIGGGSSSIHEVGNGAAGVRESLRAAVLWQLNDILLSGSMLTHHGLNSYIRSLDKVKLSGLADESSNDE